MHDPTRPYPVLFVDDDPLLLATIRRNLAKDFTLETAGSAREGLQLAAEHGPFAVVVTDLMMPEMDGIAFLHKIEQASPDTVRILLTGYASLENALAAVNEGHVFRILSKPCSMDDVRRTVTAGIEQFQLRRDREELVALRKLGQAMEGIIYALTALVETRDPYTGGHQRRVAALATAVAERLRLGAERIQGLGLAAMVHDVGKVYVPAEFLNKPGHLSEAEFSIIKAHPKIGADILAPIDFPWPIATFVLQHHERLDGSGYPQGLSAEAILLESRIIGVADVVEAMTFYRPYRHGLGLEAALTEVREHAGTLYDPEVVAACLALFQDGFFEHWNQPPET
jgi:putative two-component system response regulator